MRVWIGLPYSSSMPGTLTKLFSTNVELFCRCAILILHNVELLFNDEFKPDVDDLFCRSANRSLRTTRRGSEFCFCLETVLTIGRFQLKKGVLRALPLNRKIPASAMVDWICTMYIWTEDFTYSRYVMYVLVVPLSENFCPKSVRCPSILVAVRPKMSETWFCPKFFRKKTRNARLSF